MSLYREASGRNAKTTVAAILGALALVAGGFVAGRTTAPEPSLESQLGALREDALQAADGFELVGIHYEASSDAARTQLDRALAAFAGVEDELALVDADGTAAARSAVDELSSLVAAAAPPDEVEGAAEAARAAVRSAAGDRPS
jgi:hypothetical protein